MNKLLIFLGLVILFVASPCASESEEKDASFEVSDEDNAGEDADDEDNEDNEEDDEDDDDNKNNEEGDEDDEDNENSEEDDEDDEDNADNDDAIEDDEFVTKGEFVKTDGKIKPCKTHEACYDQREPQAWCLLKPDQSWTEKGCFCESKKHACVIERKSGEKLEYSYCAPQENWKCSYENQ